MATKDYIQGSSMLNVENTAYNLDLSRLFLALVGISVIALFADYAYMLYMHKKLVGVCFLCHALDSC
jgi:hypothetical protein